MVQQTVQIIGAYGQKSRGALSRMLLLLLLFAHQTWAGNLCRCERQQDAQHASCHITQSPAPAVPENVEADSTHHCPEVEAPEADRQIGTAPRTAVRCCDLTTESEEEAIPVSPRNQAACINPSPPIPFCIPSVAAPSFFHSRHPHPMRPLYLTYSCLLI